MKKTVWIMNHYANHMLFDHGGRHYNFAKYLQRAGYAPVVFCSNAKHNSRAECFFDSDALWHEQLAEEIQTPFVFVKSRTYTGNGKQRVLNMVDFYHNVKKTAKEYAQEHGNPDVIFASSVHPLTLVAGIQLAKHFGVKCICEVRDLWPESLVAYGIAGPHNPAVLALRRLEKWIYKKADAIIFTMEGAYDYIIEQGWEKDIPRSKVHYINNGVDLEAFNYNKEHYQVQDEDLENPNIFKVIYTGSIRKVNNLGLLLDTAKNVKDPMVKFFIWGDGDELPALEQRIRDERIDNVSFKGRVDKKCVPYIVSKADVNLLHGGNEKSNGLMRFGISPNKLFDYFAAGKPIIMDITAKYNPVEEYSAGICLNSASEIANAVIRIAKMGEDEKQTLLENVRKAAQAFDFKHLTEDLAKIIEGTT